MICATRGRGRSASALVQSSALETIAIAERKYAKHKATKLRVHTGTVPVRCHANCNDAIEMYCGVLALVWRKLPCMPAVYYSGQRAAPGPYKSIQAPPQESGCNELRAACSTVRDAACQAEARPALNEPLPAATVKPTPGSSPHERRPSLRRAVPSTAPPAGGAAAEGDAQRAH